MTLVHVYSSCIVFLPQFQSQSQNVRQPCLIGLRRIFIYLTYLVFLKHQKGIVLRDMKILKLRDGASRGRFVGLSVCRFVGLSVGGKFCQFLTSRFQLNTKEFRVTRKTKVNSIYEQTPKQFSNPTPNPKIAHQGPKK